MSSQKKRKEKSSARQVSDSTSVGASQSSAGEFMELTQQEIPSTSTGAKRIYDTMDPLNRERKVTQLVRYMVFTHGRKLPVRRKELIEKVVCEDQRAFPLLMQDANHQLESIFGLKAVEIYRTSAASGGNIIPSSRSFVLVSVIPQELCQGIVHRSKAAQEEMGLLSIILSLIMMKQSNISEDQLWNCLGRLGMAADAKHATFGDVKRLISSDFVNQMYLDREKVAAGEKHSISYGWGPRAKVEVDKEQLLAFIAEIYEGNLEQWKKQFADLIGQTKPL